MEYFINLIEKRINELGGEDPPSSEHIPLIVELKNLKKQIDVDKESEEIPLEFMEHLRRLLVIFTAELLELVSGEHKPETEIKFTQDFFDNLTKDNNPMLLFSENDFKLIHDSISKLYYDYSFINAIEGFVVHAQLYLKWHTDPNVNATRQFRDKLDWIISELEIMKNQEDFAVQPDSTDTKSDENSENREELYPFTPQPKLFVCLSVLILIVLVYLFKEKCFGFIK